MFDDNREVAQTPFSAAGERVSRMEIDDSNWPELADRLTHLEMQPEELRSVVEHVAVGLVSYFGAEHFDIWRAKEGLHRHEAW